MFSFLAVASNQTAPLLRRRVFPEPSLLARRSCETCHETITRDFRTATHARLKAPGDNAKNMGCESCHGPGSLHVKAGGGAGTIVNPRKSPTTCFQCHTEVRAAFQLPHHHPVLEGKISCADCHNPHKGDAIKGGGTNLPQKLKGGGMGLLGQNETCFQCHAAQRGPFVFEHEALREGCVSCHSPHGSVNQRLLTQRNQTLCLKCHFQQQTNGRQTLYRGFGSHKPHASGNMLVGRLPRGGPRLAGERALQILRRNPLNITAHLANRRTTGCRSVYPFCLRHSLWDLSGAAPEKRPMPNRRRRPKKPEPKNWIELGIGGLIINGDEAQFKQEHRMSGDVFGGIQDLHYEQTVGKNGTVLGRWACHLR